jgi:hypothetical protein
VVLVDQPAEQILSADGARADHDQAIGLGQRRSQSEGTMRALAVVMLGTRRERSIEMPATENQGPVEALGPDRLDHAGFEP